MAKVGDQLLQPEPGWKRYDISDYTYLKPSGYTGQYITILTGANYLNGAYVNITTTQEEKNRVYVEFKFIGTSLRLLGNRSYWKSNNIKIDIDEETYSFDQGSSQSSIKTLVLNFEKNNLKNKIHHVKIYMDADTTPREQGDGKYSFDIDAIDVDENGRLLHPDEVLDIKDLDIGKRIRCHYTATNNQVGIFSNLGKEVYVDGINDFIPPTSSATPNGCFYFICVDKDHLGRWKLIADRNIQHSISWDTLNEVGIASGSGLNEGKSKLFYTFRSPREITSSSNAFWSLPTPERPFVLKFKAYIRGGYFLFSSGGQTSSTGFSISYHGGSRYLYLKTVNRIYNIIGATMLLNQWAEYMFVWTGQGLEWYVNGKLDASKYVGTSGSYSNSQRSLTILRPNDSLTAYRGNADITEIEVYEGTLENRIPSKEADELNMHFSFYFNLKIGEKANIRLLTGGVSSTDKDNEWDKYIVNSDLNGIIEPGDNNVWNWNVSTYSWTSTTPSETNSDRRVLRGCNNVSGWSNDASNNATNQRGFRPVLLLDLDKDYKFLVEDGGEIFTIEDDWIKVGETPVTEDMFEQGFEEVNDILKPVTRDVEVTLVEFGEFEGRRLYRAKIDNSYRTIKKIRVKE